MLSLLIAAAAFSSVLHEGKWHWVSPDGQPAAQAFPFDNGADEPSEGRARYVEGGKVGFVDGEARVVIEAGWDWADRFHGGRARVCRGCVSVPVGEHAVIRGGNWGAIDPTGALVLPLREDPALVCFARGGGATALLQISRDGVATLGAFASKSKAACTLSDVRFWYRPRARRPLAELVGSTKGCDRLLAGEVTLMIDLGPEPTATLQWHRKQAVSTCELKNWDPTWFELLSRGY